MIKRIKNADTVEHTWVGQTIEAGAYHTIDPLVELTWMNNSGLLTAIATGLAVVNNGTVDITEVSSAINYLKNFSSSISSTGNPIVEPGLYTGPLGSRGMSLVTPDLGDRTTWYQKSVQVTNEILADSGNGLTFTSTNPHWVNIYSLKLTYTYKQIPKRDGTFGKHADWAITVKVDNVAVTSGFTINYAAGTITFDSSKAGSTVTATYWHNNGITHPSEWLLVPLAGKKFIVEHCELQFSVGMQVNDSVRFEIWAGANLATYGAFPDYLFDAGYGQMRAEYRNANDMINAANLGQGTIAKFGNLTKEVIVMPFNYLQAFSLPSSLGCVFRIYLTQDIPYGDTDIATTTFYTQSVSE